MGYGREEYDRVAAAMATHYPMSTCAWCNKVDHENEMYTVPATTDGEPKRYCRNNKACHERRKTTYTKGTHMNFGTYEEPAQTEGDTYKPREHYGNSCIIAVREHKPEIITSNSPNGAPGVIVDVYDLNTKTVHRDVLMMTGAIVDGFKPHAGKAPIVIKWDKRVAKNGRDYATPVPATDAAIEAAKALYANGDPFIALGTVEAEPPF